MPANDVETQSAERFTHDTQGWTSKDGNTTIQPHEMTVLHDDGLYRHVRFRSPNTSSYWFDLITWPGRLVIDGDCGTWTFAREEDMFGFFRGQRINPQYWAEKLRTGHSDGRKAATGYSEHKFRRVVAEHIDDDIEADWPGLRANVEEKFWGTLAEWDTSSEDEAHRALNEYEFGAKWTATCDRCGDQDFTDEWGAGQHRRAHTGHGHTVTVERVDGFHFCDSWEWDLRDWDFWFLWCCHAIQHGIRQWDQAKVPADA